MAFKVVGSPDENGKQRNILRHVGRNYARALATSIADCGEDCWVVDQDGILDDEFFQGAEVEELQADGIDRDGSDADEPSPIDGLNAKDAVAKIATLDAHQLALITEASAKKPRASVLKAIDDRNAELAAAAEAELAENLDVLRDEDGNPIDVPPFDPAEGAQPIAPETPPQE